MRPLREYQQKCFRFTSTLQHFALFLEMRLGKTIIAIRRIKTYQAEKILIVCPLSAFYGWVEELKKEKQEAPIELTGTRKKRLQLLGTKSK